MDKIPAGIERIVPSSVLRSGMVELEKMVEEGAVGLQQWSRAVSLIVVSRREWDEIQSRLREAR